MVCSFYHFILLASYLHTCLFTILTSVYIPFPGYLLNRSRFTDVQLERFIVARKGNFTNIKSMLLEHLKWRKEFGTDDIGNP